MRSDTVQYVGIDPGMDGALAALDDEGHVTCLLDTPTGTVGGKRDYLVADMAKMLWQVLNLSGFKIGSGRPNVHAAVERVHSMPKQGVVSSFTFGKGFGLWIGLLAGVGIPFDLVEPTRWKKALLDGMPKEKDASRVRAQQLFPGAELNLKKHHGRGDALLIAEYRRRQG